MYTAIFKNKLKSYLLIVIFSLFVAFLASLVIGRSSALIGVIIFSLIYSVSSIYIAPKIILKSVGATEIFADDKSGVYQIVENLAITSGMPMPKVYICKDPTPNAFATGRSPKHSFVCVHQGLLDILTKQELEGVLAHEMSHVKNYDIRVMAIVTALISILSILSRFSFYGGRDDRDDRNIGGILSIFMLILAPIIGTLLQLAVSRRRELLADSSGALLTRNPLGLASALQKIDNFAKQKIATTNIPETSAHIYFSTPIELGSKISKLFSTHPPIAQRIENLKEMGEHL